MLLLISLHVMANLIWIGAITSVGWLLAAGGKEGDPALAKAMAGLAMRIYRRIATPAFAASFAFGVAALAANAAYYMHAHWFHGKLTFALVVIALHHVIGAKARRAASGGVQAGGSSAILTAGLLASVFAVVLFVIFKTDLVR
jgi:putative membrane protein